MKKKKTPKPVKEKQLDLGLKQSPLNNIVKHKENLERFKAKWDIRKYTKSSWVWFTIVISISLITTQIYTVIEHINLLPKKFPLYQFYVDNTERLVSSEMVYLVPAVSLILLIIGIIFSNKFYNKERNLSNTLLMVMLCSIIIITVSLIRLINLY